MNAAVAVVLALAAVCSATTYSTYPYGTYGYQYGQYAAVPSVQYTAGYTGYPVVNQQVAYSAVKPAVYQPTVGSYYTAPVAKVATVGQQYYSAVPQYTYAAGVPTVGAQYVYNVAK